MAEQTLMADMLNVLRAQIKEDNEKSLRQVEENIAKKIDEKFSGIEAEINCIKETQSTHEKRLDAFDRELRKRNLILFGIAEEENNYSELEQLVLQILNYKLEVECVRLEIEFVGRVGKKTSKPRPIRLTLTTYGKKISILQRKKVLEGTGSYIKEDYPSKVLDTRKSLQSELQEKREKGINAFIKYDQIIIKDRQSNKRALSSSPPQIPGSLISTDRVHQTTKKTKTTNGIGENKIKTPTQNQRSAQNTMSSFVKRTLQTEKSGINPTSTSNSNSNL